MNTIARIDNTFTDRFVADCARVSFGSNADDYSDERVEKLIDYLVRNKHVNPFFHPMMTLLIPLCELNTVRLLQDKNAQAGVNIHCGVNTDGWVITASLWGWLKLAPYTQHPEEIFSIIGSKCPNTMDSYMRHNLLGVYGAYQGIYEEVPTPHHHQWFSFMFETEMATKAQLYTHTVSIAKSSQSFRYSDDVRFYIPDKWRGKADNVKQGCSDEIVEESTFYDHFHENIEKCENWYDDNNQICNEQRRLLLPQAQISKYVMTGTREAWDRVVSLRSALDAQKEVRDLMPAIQESLETQWSK